MPTKTEDQTKRVFEGGFDQLPALDVEQVRGLPRQVPLLTGLKDLFKLLSYSLRYWKAMLLSTLLMIVSSILSSVGVLMLAPILSLLLNPEMGASTAPAAVSRGAGFSLNLNSFGPRALTLLRDRWHITDPRMVLITLCSVLILATVLRSMSLFGGRWIAWSVQIKTFYRLQRDVFEHVLRQSLKFFHRHRVGSLISEIQANVTAIVGPIQSITSDLLSQPVLLLIYFGLMLRTSAKLTLVTMAAAAVTTVLSHQAGTFLRRMKRGQLSQNALVTALMQEAFYGIRIVKAFNAEHYEADYYARKTMDYLRLEEKQMLAKFAEQPVMGVIGIVSLSVVLVMGASLVIRHQLSFNGLLMFLFVAQQSMAPLAAFGSAISSTFAVLGASERVVEILGEQPEVKDGPKNNPEFRKSIAFNHVEFDYGEAPVLRDLSFRLNSGETVALVGPSGGGKSTFIDLLLRFYDPTSGEIEIDGQDIRQFTQKSYRNLFGVVPQETILFNDTVRNNIAYGRPDASESDILEAAKIANAHNFITALPRGYDTYIGDRGVRLSGGERQRLAIARAVLAKPPILVFDEATSSLDNESERLVQEAVDRVIQGRTAVIVAHRLSTVRHADRILVIQNGSVVQEGPHERLLAQQGVYKHLYNAQYSSASYDTQKD